MDNEAVGEVQWKIINEYKKKKNKIDLSTDPGVIPYRTLSVRDTVSNSDRLGPFE